MDEQKVIQNFKEYNFSFVDKKCFDATKGLKDEIKILKNILQKIYDSDKKVVKCVNFLISKIFSPISSHMILLVLKKDK